MGFSEERATGQFGPIHLLLADNPYVLWDAIEHWKSVWRSAGECSLDTLYGRQLDLDNLINLVAAVPMFGGIRLVVIHDIDKLPPVRRSGFLDALRRRCDAVRIIMTTGSLDRRLKFTKDLIAMAPVEQFPRIYEDKLPGWARRIASDFDVSLSPQASQLLAAIHGTDLFEMRQSIERAVLAVGEPRRRIEVADVESMLAGVGEHNVFALSNAIARGDLKGALEKVDALFAAERTFALTSALFTHYQRMAALVDMPNTHSDAEAARAIGVTPYTVKMARLEARQFGADTLIGALEAIFETDRAMKTSTVPPRLAIELLIYRLCDRRELTSTPWFNLAAMGIQE